jgi:hypothetical protein
MTIPFRRGGKDQVVRWTPPGQIPPNISSPGGFLPDQDDVLAASERELRRAARAASELDARERRRNR